MYKVHLVLLVWVLFTLACNCRRPYSGPFDVFFKAFYKCPDAGSGVVQYDANIARVNKTHLIYSANFTAKHGLTDSMKLILDLSVYQNKGWKDNYMHIELNKGCSDVTRLFPGLIENFMDAAGLVFNGCPIAPTYLSDLVTCGNAIRELNQQSINIALVAAPLLLIQIANFTFEAESAIRLSQSQSTGKLRVGLTKTLRPYREQINNITKNLVGTSAEQCSNANTLAYLYDTSSTSNDAVREVLLKDSSRVIVDIYAEAVHKCTAGPINNLRAKISKLSTLKKLIESEYNNNNATETIINCQSQPDEKGTYECFPKFIDRFTSLLTNFANIINPGQTQNVSDVFALDYFDQDLFFFSSCLEYANIDAAVAANIILNGIKSCAAAKGVDVSTTQISVLEPTQALPSLYNSFLPAFYTAAKPNASSDIQEVLVNLLNNQIFNANYEKARYPSTLEAFLAAKVPVEKALEAAYKANDTKTITCIEKGYKNIKALLETEFPKHQQCAENYLTDATTLLASLNASFSALRSEQIKSNPLATNPSCVSQWNSPTTYSGCQYAGVTTDQADVAYQKALDEVVQSYRQNTRANSCRLKPTMYTELFECKSGTSIAFGY